MLNPKYINRTDEELIEELREGNNEIADHLCEKYKDLVRGEASQMFMLGADREDLIQEGMIGLFKAMNQYDAGRDASFWTFAKLCISRQIYTAVQASNRKKNIPLNNYISLYGSDEDNKEETDARKDMQELWGRSPEESLIDKENVAYLEKRMAEELSELEMQVLDLRLIGMSTAEIARVLGREQKATDNAMQRIKTKLKKIMQEK